MGSTSIDMSNWSIEKKKEMLGAAKRVQSKMIEEIGVISKNMLDKQQELEHANRNILWLENEIKNYEELTK